MTITAAVGESIARTGGCGTIGVTNEKCPEPARTDPGLPHSRCYREGTKAIMALSKRTRYEVLKRDNHTCRYCGGSAPDVKLTVDHVTPVALGGSDKPDNLVAACKDCNAGKSSTAPSSDLVEDVAQSDLRWAGALARVAEARARRRAEALAYIDLFDDAWSRWWCGPDKDPIPRPANWRQSIERFHELGVPIEEIQSLVNVACGNDRILASETFRYFAGCVWKTVTEMQEAAKALLDAEDN